MKHCLVPILFVAALFAPSLASMDVVSEIHITPDGLFVAKNLLVIQRNGTNVFSRATWGQSFIRVTVLLNASTTVSKSHGESATASDIKENDRFDVEGDLVSGADSFIVNAVRIRDSALEQAVKTISGTVQSLNASALSFVLANKQFANTTVTLSASTPIKKGMRAVEFSDIAVGDKVLSASGIYDYPTNTLAASSIEMYQNKSVFTPRNFEGTLKSISSTVLPATLIVTVNSIDYTIYINTSTVVLSKSKKPTSLTRFVVGDMVRFYGAIRQTNLTEIDADTLRDLNF